jgi:hypothetical protein
VPLANRHAERRPHLHWIDRERRPHLHWIDRGRCRRAQPLHSGPGTETRGRCERSYSGGRGWRPCAVSNACAWREGFSLHAGASERARNFHEKQLVKQWITEVEQTDATGKPYRLVIRRQLIEHRKGQRFLFDEYRYCYIVTSLPSSVSTQEVVDLTYERCDQENVIEQLGSGLVAWRIPVAEFDGNSAWLEIPRLAWNLAKWIAQLALPAEVVRWEWTRFRQAFVYVAAQAIRRSRQIVLRFSAAHRWLKLLVAAHQQLQV